MGGSLARRKAGKLVSAWKSGRLVECKRRVSAWCGVSLTGWKTGVRLAR